MEPLFGQDFSTVRIHHDASAARAARAAGARAYALQDDLVFAAGQYRPHTQAGRSLLVHELAHVVQQRRGGSCEDTEARADRAAGEVMAGHAVTSDSLGGAPWGVQAKPDDAPDAETLRPAEATQATDWRHFTRVVDQFALNKDTLTSAHRDVIDELAFSISLHTGMLAHGKARIEIVGHADTTGKDPRNDELGQDRADRVKEALERKLAAKDGEKPLTIEWSVRSAGERELLIPTADNTLEPRNRAVEVRVTIEATPAPAPIPNLDPRKQTLPGNEPPPGPRREPNADLWKRMQQLQEKIDEYDRKHPKRTKSAQDVIVGAVMDTVVDPILKGLPLSESTRSKARELIRGGLEKGTEKACEAAIDAIGLPSDEAAAIKAGCKAGLRTKLGSYR